MRDKIFLYNLRQQVVLYSSLPVGHKDMDSYEDKDVVDAFTRDVQNTQVCLMLIVWIVHQLTYLEIKLSKQDYKIFQIVSVQIKPLLESFLWKFIPVWKKSQTLQIFFNISGFLKKDMTNKLFFAETTRVYWKFGIKIIFGLLNSIRKLMNFAIKLWIEFWG